MRSPPNCWRSRSSGKKLHRPQAVQGVQRQAGTPDEDGRGVLTGLTRVAEIQSYNVTEGRASFPPTVCSTTAARESGDVVTGSGERGRFAFEEAAYLLLFGELPTADKLRGFLRAAGLLPDTAHQLFGTSS